MSAPRIDTLGQSASCGDITTMNALSPAETLASHGSVRYLSTIVQQPGPLKNVLTIGPIPTVDVWLQGISRPRHDPPTDFRLNRPATVPLIQPEKNPTSSPESPFCRQPPTGARSTYARVLAGKTKLPNADISVGFSGPGPQPLRGIPGFPGQQAPQTRNAPLGSGRLQNGKIGARTCEGCTLSL